MAPVVCLVQGASRGLGLAFCRALLSRSADTSVIATCRSPAGRSGLQNLQEQHPQQLTLLPLDIRHTGQIEETFNVVKEKFGRVDLLINSAGILHPSGRGETSISAVTSEDLYHTMLTNAIGPLMMAKYFAPLLRNGQGVVGVQSSDYKDFHASILVNISAAVGSITDNEVGGWYSYRLSKAALNMVTKNVSVELGRGRRKVLCVSLDPGTVDTDLTRQHNVPNLLSVEQSVSRMMKVIDSLALEDSGKFFNNEKVELPF